MKKIKQKEKKKNRAMHAPKDSGKRASVRIILFYARAKLSIKLMTNMSVSVIQWSLSFAHFKCNVFCLSLF